MMSIARRIERYWFTPMPALRLGMLRAAIGGYALWYVCTRRDLIIGLADKSELLYSPVGVFRLLSSPIDPVAVQWMVFATIAIGVLFVLGAFHRYSGPAFALLLLVTLCYRNSWSMIYHMHNVLVIHVVILGFTKSADRFSIDYWLNGKTARQKSWQFGWPIRLICMVTALCYFLAGAAKILGPEGFGWASGESLRSQIAVDAIRKEVLDQGAMGAAFALHRYVWLFGILGAGTLFLELAAPLLVFGKRTSRWWAIATWIMHWGMFLIMGIRFRYQLSFIMFLPFFRVERLAKPFRRRRWNASRGLRSASMETE